MDSTWGVTPQLSSGHQVHLHTHIYHKDLTGTTCSEIFFFLFMSHEMRMRKIAKVEWTQPQSKLSPKCQARRW